MHRYILSSLSAGVMASAALLTAPSGAAAQDAPKIEVSAGYQMVGFKSGLDETLPVGWYADVAGNLGRYFAAVFQVGGNYKTISESQTIAGITGSATAKLRVHEFLGGVRVKAAPTGAVTPFAQLLVGGVNGSADVTGSVTGGGTTIFSSSASDSSTDLGIQVGGGVNFRLTEGLGLRAAADYLRLFSDDEGVNGFRVAVGAVFPF